VSKFSIEIPNLDRLIAESHARARMVAGMPAGRAVGMAFANHAANHAERPALRGFACVYHQPFERDGGKLYAFMPGCFKDTLASGREVKVQISHIPGTIVGSTKSGLSLIDTPDGLAFEFATPKTQLGAMLVSMVACGSQPDVSVGEVDVLESITRTFSGREVKMITKATLGEISICRDGAVPQSHVRLVDLDETPLTLRDEIDRGLLALQGRMNEVVTGAKERSLAEASRQPAKQRRVAVWNSVTGRAEWRAR
jgi:HK97 family phage prohead protease